LAYVLTLTLPYLDLSSCQQAHQPHDYDFLAELASSNVGYPIHLLHLAFVSCPGFTAHLLHLLHHFTSHITALEHTLNLDPYGFTNIHHEVFKIPIGTWPKNKTLKTVGLYMRTAVLDRLDAMSFGPLCRGLGWSKEEVQVYLVDVRKCLMDNTVHSYFPFHVSYRQKPENETKDE
jgi:hypothetical protein